MSHTLILVKLEALNEKSYNEGRLMIPDMSFVHECSLAQSRFRWRHLRSPIYTLFICFLVVVVVVVVVAVILPLLRGSRVHVGYVCISHVKRLHRDGRETNVLTFGE